MNTPNGGVSPKFPCSSPPELASFLPWTIRAFSVFLKTALEYWYTDILFVASSLNFQLQCFKCKSLASSFAEICLSPYVSAGEGARGILKKLFEALLQSFPKRHSEVGLRKIGEKLRKPLELHKLRHNAS